MICERHLLRTFKYNPDRFNVLSSGGGTQSNAIICMIHAGILPKPDVIVMADTERESSNVIAYQQQYMQPLCDEMNVEYHMIPKSNFTTDDIFANKMILPGYFSEWNGRNKKGQCSGKLMSTCSDRWKVQVIRRFLNDKFGQSYLTKRGVDMWLGMSFDEARRIKITTGKWMSRYPLFEMFVDRKLAIKFVEDYGLPTPPRSACWMCPNRNDSEWLYMKRECPKDFQQAIEHEKLLQEQYPHLWLTKHGIPLDKIKFNTNDTDISIKNTCGTGLCFN